MKKMVSLICVLALIFALAPSAQAIGTIALSLGDATISAGNGTQNVEVPLVLSGNQDGVCGIYLKMTYDSGIKMVSVRQGDALRSLVYTAPDDLNKTPFILMWDGLNAEKGDGTILYITFAVPANHATDYHIRLLTTDASVYDDNLEDYHLQLNDGTVHVKGEGAPSEGDSGQGGTSSEDPTKTNDGNDNPGDENGESTAGGKGEPSNPSDSSSAPVLKCSYYVVLTMTDEGKTEECRVAYYPYGAATDTITERTIDLGRISSVMVKLLEHVEGSAPAGQNVICYLVTTESGRVDVEATNQLNKIGE